MPSHWQQQRNAILLGTQAAAREQQRLGLNLETRIEIFRVIEDAGIWLMFQQLHDLLGALVDVDGVPGILVNSQHPLGLRRYTAAHEYGHWVLDHRSVFDDADAVLAPAASMTEIAAQAFAGRFLMPDELLNRALPADLESPVALYRAAVEIGVTYAALLTHLQLTGRLTQTATTALRECSPKSLKLALSNGRKPQNPWADVWSVGESEPESVRLGPSDEVHVFLPEIPSSGYLWEFSPVGVTELVYDGYDDAHDIEVLGAVRTRHWALRQSHRGDEEIAFKLLRPWDPASTVTTRMVRLQSTDEELAGSVDGISPRQQPTLLAARG